jgi:hypothetical protein
MLIVRKLHTYVGMFIAPSVIFFALSGALQLFHLHEARGSYHPPALIEMSGALHKDQVLSSGADHDKPPPAVGGAGQQRHKAPSLATVVLKWFFLSVSLGLLASTGIGVWIGLKYARRKRFCWMLLGMGTAAPILIILSSTILPT